MKAESSRPIPAAKVLRVYQLIEKLSCRAVKVSALAESMDMGERTVYRYLKLLEELNFQVILRKGNVSLGKDYKPYFVSRLIKIYQS
jgi:predicted DNA-binding transcriptional regulator YafY